MVGVIKCTNTTFSLSWIASNSRELCLSASAGGALSLAACDCSDRSQAANLWAGPGRASDFGPVGAALAHFEVADKCLGASLDSTSSASPGASAAGAQEGARPMGRAAAVLRECQAEDGSTPVDVTLDVQVSPVFPTRHWRTLSDGRGACLQPEGPGAVEGAELRFGPCFTGPDGGPAARMQFLFSPLPSETGSPLPSFHLRLRQPGADGRRLCAGVPTPTPYQGFVLAACRVRPAANSTARQAAELHSLPLAGGAGAVSLVSSDPVGFVSLGFPPASTPVSQARQYCSYSVGSLFGMNVSDPASAVTFPCRSAADFAFVISFAYGNVVPILDGPQFGAPPDESGGSGGGTGSATSPYEVLHADRDSYLSYMDYVLPTIAAPGTAVNGTPYASASLTLYGSAFPVLIEARQQPDQPPLNQTNATTISNASNTSSQELTRVVIAAAYVEITVPVVKSPDAPSRPSTPRPRRPPPARRRVSPPAATRIDIKQGPRNRGGFWERKIEAYFAKRNRVGLAADWELVRPSPSRARSKQQRRTARAGGQRHLLQSAAGAATTTAVGLYAMLGGPAFLTAVNADAQLADVVLNLTVWAARGGRAFGEDERAVLRTADPAFVPFVQFASSARPEVFAPIPSSSEALLPLAWFTPEDCDLYIVNAFDPSYGDLDLSDRLTAHMGLGKGIFAVAPQEASTEQGLAGLLEAYRSPMTGEMAPTNQGLAGTGVALLPRSQRPAGGSASGEASTTAAEARGFVVPGGGDGEGGGGVVLRANLAAWALTAVEQRAVLRPSEAAEILTGLRALLETLRGPRHAVQRAAASQLLSMAGAGLSGFPSETELALGDPSYQACVALDLTSAANAPLLREGEPAVPGKGSCEVALREGLSAGQGLLYMLLGVDRCMGSTAPYGQLTVNATVPVRQSGAQCGFRCPAFDASVGGFICGGMDASTRTPYYSVYQT